MLCGSLSFRNYVTSLHPVRTSTSTRRGSRADRSSRRFAATRLDDAVLDRLEDALAVAQLRPEPPAMTFAESDLPPTIVTALSRAGIERPTAIQVLTLPDALAGRDVLGRAETGSGKTLAFGLPLVSRLLASGTRCRGGAPRGLVLVPTRELAQQVADALSPAARAAGMHIATVVGGTSINRQVVELRRGVDVLVATPGRLLDLMERHLVALDAVEVAVLDEADHMAELGFLPDVTRILDATPPQRQCLLFSATLDRGVGALVRRYLREPAVHAAGSSATPADKIDHRVFIVDHEKKTAVAAEIAARPGRTLFFVRTKHGADRLAKQLTRLGVQTVAVHGNLNQNQRVRALAAFSSGRSRVLVATDVAARGLHIDDLDLVVHFDPAAGQKDYLHRSGRTARAGASGTVLSFVEPGQVNDVARLHRVAAIEPTSTRVRPGSPAVRGIAESGEVIDLPPMPHSKATREQRQPRARRLTHGVPGARR
jgi:superfamily II DNA/RNA helicase